jgi:hypothetical protein
LGHEQPAAQEARIATNIATAHSTSGRPLALGGDPARHAAQPYATMRP